MTTNAERAALLAQRVAGRSRRGQRRVTGRLYGRSEGVAPAMSVASASELVAELDRPDDAFSGIDLTITPLDVGGDDACAEWSLAMTHSGALVLPDGTTIEATGARLFLIGVTVAEFRADRIRSLRQYWDEFAVLEQLGLVTRQSE